jgi:pimeloyl-ACP methyl ester carboxylesterase
VTASDGLTLHVRSYGSCLTSALPVVCLPGLARTAADFHPLAAALAADPAKPRLVLALDYRGHGQSKYDHDPDNYTLPVTLADLSGVLTALEIAPAIFVGTSYGGLLAMMLAVWRPTAIAGVILNDIGPVIEPRGLVRIKGYVRKSCAGGSARSSPSSHRRIGSRLPSAPGASTAAASCPITI